MAGGETMGNKSGVRGIINRRGGCWYTVRHVWVKVSFEYKERGSTGRKDK